MNLGNVGIFVQDVENVIRRSLKGSGDVIQVSSQMKLDILEDVELLFYPAWVR